MKRTFAIFMAFALFFTPMTVSAAASPSVSAKSAIIMDALTGKVLYAKDAEERRYPASTTKMMTLIVALEHGNLEDVVTASANAANTEGSTIWLTPGEQLSMKDMLYGIMLVSGNDATVAVAEKISGSVDKFARLMTEKAHAIGATNTNFTNSSGLPDPNHYTTAHDLARIAAYGYRNPIFEEIVSTKHKTIPWAGKGYERDLYNENRMLWLYDGGNGVKTGYTDAAGRCLVSAAKRNGVQLVAVVLDSDTMWNDSIALLDYGFSQIQPATLVKKGDILKTLRVNNGKTDSIRLAAAADIVVPVASGEADKFRIVVDAPSKIDAPVAIGQKIGSIKVMYDNKEVSAVELVSLDGAERKSFFGAIWNSLWSFFTFVVRNFA